jgi:hypothetical protein
MSTTSVNETPLAFSTVIVLKPIISHCATTLVKEFSESHHFFAMSSQMLLVTLC